MCDHCSVPRYYAILIGIDAYQDKPLNGCVWDVQNIKTCLAALPNPVNVQMFAASKSADLESPDPAEDLILWPTYQNVTAALRTIISLAKAGDFVYIHYSGHGTRATPDRKFSNASTGDLALVLLDREKESHVRYLWGPILALLLNAMVDKGLEVTVVLDCCFSASVYRRDDFSIRCLPYDTEIDSNYPVNAEECFGVETGHLVSRDVSMLPNWLINPDGYAILAACGPHEEASELTTEDGKRHGALSYFLLNVIECSGFGRKHKDIYDQLRSRFRRSWPQQSPVLYGNKGQGFFGHNNSELTRAAVPIIEKTDKNFELQAGQAHGICDGDVFAIYPLNSAEHSLGSERDRLVGKVTSTRAFSSNLVGIEMTSICARIGLIAMPLTRCSFQKLPIRLASGLPQQHELLTALKGRSLNAHNDERRPFSFHITLNSKDEYEIHEYSHQNITNLPIMTKDQTDVGGLCDIMEHLVRFSLVRDLANGSVIDSFRESFSAHISKISGEIFYAGTLIEAKHDEVKFELLVENVGNEDLYVYVYDLGPCWQVTNILKASYEVIPPRNRALGFTGTFKKKIRMVVPAEITERGLCQCEDIIKVFVTSQPTSFDLLELSKLGEKARESVNRPTISKTCRQGGRYSREDWSALNFPIRTFCNRL